MISIKIEQKHIDLGKRGSCTHCPIALAATEQFPREEIEVGGKYIDFIKGRARRRFLFPQEAFDFVLSFDNNREVHPFSFKIDQTSFTVINKIIL